MTNMANYGKAKNDKITLVFSALAILAVAAFGAFALRSGIRKTERAECMKWQGEADTFKHAGYYLTAWQAAQCAHYGININALIEK